MVSVDDDRRMSETVVTELNKDPVFAFADLLEINKGLVNAAKANFQKLQLYLQPRVDSLILNPLAAAQQSARDDIARLARNIATCVKACPIPTGATSSQTRDGYECTKACWLTDMPDRPTVLGKRQSCRELSWLPI
jgi:hypothetical protein